MFRPAHTTADPTDAEKVDAGITLAPIVIDSDGLEEWEPGAQCELEAEDVLGDLPTFGAAKSPAFGARASEAWAKMMSGGDGQRVFDFKERMRANGIENEDGKIADTAE